MVGSSHSTSVAPNIRERVIQKVAWRLLPFLGLLYFVNYLDRTNIGFAAPHGMNDALGFDKAAFGLASGIFFIGYLLLEVPSNLMLHKVGARRWIARIMVSWGIVASAMAFVPNGLTMYALRFVLGIAEAGSRILSNQGGDGNQEVPHFHLHVFAGKNLGRMIKPIGK